MRASLGESRSVFARNHAVISPDSHERVTLPDWPDAELVHLVTPQAGAGFSLFLCHASAGLRVGAPAPNVQRFVLVREGAFSVQIDGTTHTLQRDGYAFVAAGQDHEITAASAGTLLVLELRYRPLRDRPAPASVVSSMDLIEPVPMKGDTRLNLQKLMPRDSSFDFEINVMDFAPGASLPYVETHFMEHGLVILEGGGIYRLAESWYPVEAGDAIWMGPFCPQWFGAIGRTNARYLIYKNWNRDPLA